MTWIQRGLISLLLTIAIARAEIKNKGWWSHEVFYQIYPRSFRDSDNDGVGDLKGITDNLDHFEKAGVGAIWLSPINTSPMVDFGYDISDFRDIDPVFGNLNDFDELVKKAKEKKLKVILDLVPNHTSDKHFWFQQSIQNIGKYKDYYIWAKGKNNNEDPPNNWLSVFGESAWTYNEARDEWYFHQFERRQPDLNYNNPNVKAEMEEIITYWLRKGLDGFRIDAVPHLFEDDISKDEPKSGLPGVSPVEYAYLNHTYTKDHPKTYELVQSWRRILDEYADSTNTDEKVMMTEAYTSLENTTRFYKVGSHVPFNFKFIMDVSGDSSAADFENVIKQWVGSMPSGAVANWVMGNHDRSRVLTRYPGRADQMTMLAMVLPGVAVTYYGEEIGMEDNQNISFKDTKDPQGCIAGEEKYRQKSRDPCRTPFQWDHSLSAGFSNNVATWLPIHENYKHVNLAIQQREKEESHFKVYQALTQMRKSSYALKEGKLKTKVLEKEVLAVVRDATNETITLLINFSKQNKVKVNLLSLVSNGESKIQVKSVGANVNMTVPVKLSAVEIPANASIVIFTKSGAMAIHSDTLKLFLLAMSSALFAFMR